MFKTKIDAISFLNKLPIAISQNTNQYGVEIQQVKIAKSLGELNAIVQAIMELGPSTNTDRVQFLERACQDSKDYAESLLEFIKQHKQTILNLDEEVARLKKENSQLESMTKNIMHCDECGDDFYATGFNGHACNCTEINKLEREVSFLKTHTNQYRDLYNKLNKRVKDLVDSI